LRDEGYQIVAVEVAEGAASYRDFDYADKVCLVLGNEKKGVYPNVLRQCNGAVIIPMAGKGRSLNVVVAGSIVAYEALLR
jgi:tRNA (guanosine-2'-O-)-methyltransferase